MSDGTVSRFLYIGASAHKTTNSVPYELLSVQPNMVHVLIVIRTLAEYKPMFVFGQYENELETPNIGKFFINIIFQICSFQFFSIDSR